MIPSPRAQPLVGHLGRWGTDPLALMEEGAELAQVFGLRLWRRAVVGYSPEWNRAVLGNLRTFRSKGSFSALTPYLNAGVVHTDEPEHAARRSALNPGFARAPVGELRTSIAAATDAVLPAGRFEAREWSSTVVREILAVTFFGGRFPADLLADFLDPLEQPLPAPFLRRPKLFRRMDHALRDALARASVGTLAAAFAGQPDGVAEARVALSAAYDTTAHTLSWLLYHVAREPRFADESMRASVINEVLRLYPAGWLGSRRCAETTQIGGVVIPRGTPVIYSPYLTHRDPAQWKDPTEFRPERFEDPLPAWGFLPFSAGPRTCLGTHLARLVLDTVLDRVARRPLRVITAEPAPVARITLVPAGPIVLERGETQVVR